jgi:excisionase family DNA binding protein
MPNYLSVVKKEFLTTKEVAERLKVHKSSIIRAFNRGDLKGIKKGNQILISVEDVKEIEKIIKNWLDIQTLCKQSGYKKKTIYHFVRKGILKPVKIFSKFYFPPQSLTILTERKQKKEQKQKEFQDRD